MIGLTNMTDVWHLDTLPSDVLIIIFDYCHAFDLVRLSEVCTRFYDIIREETLWIKKSKQPIVTNQASKKFRERYTRLWSEYFVNIKYASSDTMFRLSSTQRLGLCIFVCCKIHSIYQGDKCTIFSEHTYVRNLVSFSEIPEPFHV